MPTPKAPIPKHEDRLTMAKTKSHAFHNHNPTGSKLVKRIFKVKHGYKAGSYEQALEWFTAYDPANVQKTA